jgi:hypothetical protein
VAHILSNRAKIEAGRSETVVLVGASGGTVWYQAVAGVLWYDAGAVPAGIANRIAEVTRQPWDAIAVFPHATAFPGDLRLVARTATATQAGVAAAQTYTVLDRRREGLGTRGSGGGANYGDRWLVKLRLRR